MQLNNTKCSNKTGKEKGNNQQPYELIPKGCISILKYQLDSAK